MASWSTPPEQAPGTWWEPARPMTVPRRPIGNLIRTAFGVYSRSFVPFLCLSGLLYAIGAIVLVPAYLALSDIVARIIVVTPTTPGTDLTTYQATITRLLPQEGALTVLVAVVLGLVQVLALGAVSGGTPEAALGQPVRVGIALRRFVARLAPLLGLVLVLVVLQSGLSVASVALQLSQPSLLAASTSTGDLSGLGSVLGTLALAGLATLALAALTYYLYLRWFVAIPLMVIDGLGLRAAVGRSAQLTHGSRAYILGTLVLLALLQTLLALVVELLAAIIGLAFGAGSLVSGSGASGVTLSAGVGSVAGHLTTFASLIDLLMGALYYPVFAITMAILRSDLSWRADAVARLQAVPPVAPPAP